jgi:hypothetical protein
MTAVRVVVLAAQCWPHTALQAVRCPAMAFHADTGTTRHCRATGTHSRASGASGSVLACGSGGTPYQTYTSRIVPVGSRQNSGKAPGVGAGRAAINRPGARVNGVYAREDDVRCPRRGLAQHINGHARCRGHVAVWWLNASGSREAGVNARSQ